MTLRLNGSAKRDGGFRDWHHQSLNEVSTILKQLLHWPISRASSNPLAYISSFVQSQTACHVLTSTVKRVPLLPSVRDPIDCISQWQKGESTRKRHIASIRHVKKRKATHFCDLSRSALSLRVIAASSTPASLSVPSCLIVNNQPYISEDFVQSTSGILAQSH